MVELGLHDVFGEVNDVEEKNREATCEHGSKWTYFVLRIEGVMKNCKYDRTNRMQWNCGFGS